MAIGGAVFVALSVLFLHAGDGSLLILSCFLLLIGAVLLPLGVMMHLDRRMRELAKELFQMKAELLGTKNKVDKKSTEGDANAAKEDWPVNR